jgi:hypothetical protein
MPFVLLVLALLGGGLVCLLVINTTLGSSSFRISQLQTENANLSLQQQSLQGQIQSEEGPAQIEAKAYKLGMRVEPATTILDLRTHRYYRLSGGAGSDTVGTGAVGTGAAGTGTGGTGTGGTGAGSPTASTGARHPATSRAAGTGHHARKAKGKAGSGR